MAAPISSVQVAVVAEAAGLQPVGGGALAADPAAVVVSLADGRRVVSLSGLHRRHAADAPAPGDLGSDEEALTASLRVVRGVRVPGEAADGGAVTVVFRTGGDGGYEGPPPLHGGPAAVPPLGARCLAAAAADAGSKFRDAATRRY